MLIDDEADFVPDRAQTAHEAGIYDLGFRAAIQQLMTLLSTGRITPPPLDPYPPSAQYRHATDMEAAQGSARDDVWAARLITDREMYRQRADAAETTIARVRALAARWVDMSRLGWSPWQEPAEQLKEVLHAPSEPALELERAPDAPTVVGSREDRFTSTEHDAALYEARRGRADDSDGLSQ